jgi:hypothetical protein
MSEHHKPLFRDADLSKRYGRTSRTINEWKRKKILPPPDMTIQDRDYWYAETIETNERKRFSAKPSGVAAGSASAEPISAAAPRPTQSRPAPTTKGRPRKAERAGVEA